MKPAPKEKTKRFWARYAGQHHFFVETDSKFGTDWNTHCGISMSIRPLEIRAETKCTKCEAVENQAEQSA